MKVGNNSHSLTSPYKITDESYDLHEKTPSVSQYDITHHGLFMFDSASPYVYGVYTVVIDGVTYEQSEQIANGYYNWIEFKNGNDIKVYNNNTQLSVNLQHTYSKIRLGFSSSRIFRILGKYY